MDPDSGGDDSPRLGRPRISRAALPLLLVGLLACLDAAQAASVSNGDFETGDFTGWTLLSDGGAGHTSDFAVVYDEGDYEAHLLADYYANSGDISSAPITQVFIANALAIPLNLTIPPGERYAIAFAWELSGEEAGGVGGEVFSAALTDGNGERYGADGKRGMLHAPTSNYGSGTVFAVLDPLVFNNATGWTLEVQLGRGVDPDAFQPNALGSTLTLDDIRLVPEPDRLWALAAGLLGLHLLVARRSGRARPSQQRRILPTRFGARGGALLLLLASTLAQAASAATGWTDITASTTPSVTGKSFDFVNQVLLSHATIENSSQQELGSRLRLVIVDPSLRVLNHDGLTGDAEPYFDLPALSVAMQSTVRVEFPWVRAPLSYGVRVEQLPSPSVALQILSGPTLTMDPNNLTPLAGRITATTNVPARVTVDVSSALHSYAVELPEHYESHSFHLLGMRSNTTYTVGLTFTDADGNEVVAAPVIQAITPPLPDDFPTIDVLTSQPQNMQPGFTLLDRFARSTTSSDERYSVIVDAEGEVVWYCSCGGTYISQLPTGELRWSKENTTATMLGETVDYPLEETVGRLHHDVYETEYGTFLSISGETFVESNYPSSDLNPDAPPASASVRDEPIAEFKPDGSLLALWPMRDLIDTTRIGFGSLVSCATANGCDWVHNNAVYHDTSDDSIIASARHQDAVINFDRVTGRLKWILGPHANWTAPYLSYLLSPIVPLEWSYHQHSMMLTPSGTLLLFDNHNEGRSPFDGTPFIPESMLESRAVEYSIDEATMEVRQVWEYRKPYAERLYSPAMSDADILANGNTLIDFGTVKYEGGAFSEALGKGSRHAHIIEVDHATPPNVVFELEIYLPDGGAGEILMIYRAARIPSLYPPTH